MIESFAQKVYLLVQPHLPVAGGTFFHLLFMRMKSKETGAKYSLLDLINIALISFALGVLIQYVTIGYYEFKGLEPKDGVLLALGIVVAMLGFNGLVFFIKKFQFYFDKFINAIFDKFK